MPRGKPSRADDEKRRNVQNGYPSLKVKVVYIISALALEYCWLESLSLPRPPTELGGCSGTHLHGVSLWHWCKVVIVAKKSGGMAMLLAYYYYYYYGGGSLHHLPYHLLAQPLPVPHFRVAL